MSSSADSGAGAGSFFSFLGLALGFSRTGGGAVCVWLGSSSSSKAECSLPLWCECAGDSAYLAFWCVLRRFLTLSLSELAYRSMLDFSSRGTLCELRRSPVVFPLPSTLSLVLRAGGFLRACWASSSSEDDSRRLLSRTEFLTTFFLLAGALSASFCGDGRCSGRPPCGPLVSTLFTGILSLETGAATSVAGGLATGGITLFVCPADAGDAAATLCTTPHCTGG
uniref:Secreted protein n=1 Tax=Ixodes ricinus TaxID=34613 RepID=A0A6B0V3P1_IXORI